jgi:prolyl 4-hydroxylase
MVTKLVEAAYAELERENWQFALQILEDGGRAGDQGCLVELGAWFLAGQIVQRDLGRARDCFRLAGAGGNAQAASIYRNFLAIGVGGERDWAGALGSLRQAAAQDQAAGAQIALLDAMATDANGNPTLTCTPNIISTSPFVASFKQLLTTAECDYLIRLALPNLHPSLIVDPRTGGMRPDPVRTSDAAMFAWAAEDLVVHAINRRIAAASGTAAEAGEPLQVLCYGPGQEYHPHFDALPNVTNQRILTVLVFLNDAFQGGETRFPKSGIRFRGKVGEALLFRNALPDGRPDPASLHAGAPVTRGTKYIASRWIHQHAFAPLT